MTSHFLSQWWSSILTHICVTRRQCINILKFNDALIGSGLFVGSLTAPSHIMMWNITNTDITIAPSWIYFSEILSQFKYFYKGKRYGKVVYKMVTRSQCVTPVVRLGQLWIFIICGQAALDDLIFWSSSDSRSHLNKASVWSGCHDNTPTQKAVILNVKHNRVLSQLDVGK